MTDIQERRDTEASKPSSAEPGRGVQAASCAFDDGHGDRLDEAERIGAWRAVLLGDLLGLALTTASAAWSFWPAFA